MFIAALFKVAKKWKQLSAHQLMRDNKIRFIHIVEYYLARKRNEVLIHATSWMQTESIMLSKRRQSPRAIGHMIPFL